MQQRRRWLGTKISAVTVTVWKRNLKMNRLSGPR